MNSLASLDPAADARDLSAFIAVDLPDTNEIAFMLALHYPDIARALLSCRRNREGVLYAQRLVTVLRSLSFVDIQTAYLTAYGLKVRRWLVHFKRWGFT